MTQLISEYRVHLVGLLALAVLLHYWRAGELSDGSFWILGVTAAIELGIWGFFRHQFAEFAGDQRRIDYDARRAAIWAKKGTA